MRTFFLLMAAFFPVLLFSQPNTDIFLFDLNIQDDRFELSNVMNISNTDGYDNQPSFMDNTTILYAGTRNGQTDIVRYNLQDNSKDWLSDTKGSEYSPLKIPIVDNISAIRLETNGDQTLYRYDMKTGASEILYDDLVIGYHLWMDANALVATTLVQEQMNLNIMDFTLHKTLNIDTNVGRSLQNLPFTIPANVSLAYVPRKFAYVDKKTSPWQIVSYDLNNGKKETVAALLPDVEDFIIVDSKFLIGKGSDLYLHGGGTTGVWKEVASLKGYGITNITRLAISPDGTKLAVVGEASQQLLEPKLENIKWIAGNWKGEAFGGITEEHWSEPSGGSMMATFKLIEKGEVVFYEIEIIREVNNTLLLQLKHFDNHLKGWETKDETVDFPLKEITANKVVFEGMVFEKISDTEMNVHVEIHQDTGAVETVIFNYKK